MGWIGLVGPVGHIGGRSDGTDIVDEEDDG